LFKIRSARCTRAGTAQRAIPTNFGVRFERRRAMEEMNELALTLTLSHRMGAGRARSGWRQLDGRDLGGRAGVESAGRRKQLGTRVERVPTR